MINQTEEVRKLFEEGKELTTEDICKKIKRIKNRYYVGRCIWSLMNAKKYKDFNLTARNTGNTSEKMYKLVTRKTKPSDTETTFIRQCKAMRNHMPRALKQVSATKGLIVHQKLGKSAMNHFNAVWVAQQQLNFEAVNGQIPNNNQKLIEVKKHK